ncbi:phosphoribosyltransferase family protein [Niallia nealsonii]|uniref:Phosphoribosyltransferase n=1 Tax=Niallia nealsonii TaxID=115979 RepID=A0A2N0Z3I3_9BACI|nr:phosphoribosyltransferase family protein [Niallia nealsonii]PKG24039.1 hypothetical protein CWS01_08180 [Niallia nealsonii]
MKNSHTLTCSNKKILLSILDDLQMEIEITGNPFQLSVEDFFLMAARINKKRSFLFVSKLLGKHLPIHPNRGLLTGFLLAARYEEIKTNQPSFKKESLLAYYHDPSLFADRPYIDEEVSSPVIIGFAETATSLGHSFYQAFKHAVYFHTTREVVNEAASIISFEEEHSHATSHRCYVGEEMLKNEREVILVDDELTTGKTAINIIRDIQTKFPRKLYTVVSILDWRSEEDSEKMLELEKELDIKIHFVSLLKGRFTLHNGHVDFKENIFNHMPNSDFPQVEYLELTEFISNRLIPYTSNTLSMEKNNFYYLVDTGRFGIESNQTDDEWMKKAGQYLSLKRTGEKTLVIGTGEFMYIPMKIASYMGENIWYQSSTRSPIYPNKEAHYGAKTAYRFPNPEDGDIVHYLYNIERGSYDDVFIIFERKVDHKKLAPLLQQLNRENFKKINIVYCNGREQ